MGGNLLPRIKLILIPVDMMMLLVESCTVQLSDEIKQNFFHVVATSILLEEYTTWTLSKYTETKVNGIYKRILLAVLNLSRKLHNKIASVWPSTSHRTNYPKSDLENMSGTAREVRKSSKATFCYRPLNVDKSISVDHQRRSFIISGWTLPSVIYDR